MTDYEELENIKVKKLKHFVMVLRSLRTSSDEATDMEPALAALRHLRLGSSPAPRGKLQQQQLRDRDASTGGSGAPSSQQHQDHHQLQEQGGGTGIAGGDMSLAVRLLPAFCAAYASGGAGGRQLDLLTGAESAGLLFTLYLQYGAAWHGYS